MELRFLAMPVRDEIDVATRRRTATLAVAAVLLLGIGIADYVSRPEIAFSLFYVLVIALAAWFTADIALTLAAAVMATIVWLAAEWLSLDAPTTGVLLWNTASRLVIFVGAGVLICRLRNALDLAQQLARTDFVTEALNARAFDEIARMEVSRARRYKRPLTVTYLDLDDFKRVNDRYGHRRGDSILRAVAKTLRSSLRHSDTVARIGGDEFVVLLPETGYEQAQEVLPKLQQSLASALREAQWPVTVSMGAAVFDVPPADVDALLQAADATMYKAKADGKNRFRISRERPAVEPLHGWRRPSQPGNP